MSDRDTTRRRFLQVAGGTTTIALAGCTGSDGGGDETTEGMMDDGTTEEMMSDTTTEEMMDETTDEGMDDEETMDDGPTDPADAPRAEIDRFSEDAGTLHVRSENDELPGPDEPIDFDRAFLVTGLGPDGETVQYYDFDVQPTAPAPIYAFFREGEDAPVEGQLNVVGTIPGDDGYNDFWHVHRVTVPEGYAANTVTSAADLMEADYDVEATDAIKNCPVVPDESTASMRHGDGDAALVDGWYDGQVVSYFLFEEAPLETTDDGSVPRSPIYVSFNENPGEDGGGPASGFLTEEMSDQTHNVAATLPDDEGYSPLWMVNVYDNADFDDVSDLASATDAELLASGAANVNCPVVSVG
jgi:hypothetical protein